jgi:CPA1 family monovalent cation:H+ antiporter
VVSDVLGALDVEESMLDVRSRRLEEMRRSDDATVRLPTTIARCRHLAAAPDHVEPNAVGVCEDCIVEGTTWVHLRLCLTCGHMACCDSSPRRHASAHFRGTEHPVMESAEPGESWRWCFVDNRVG